MNRRDLLKAALLATPVAQAAYMSSKYGLPEDSGWDFDVISYVNSLDDLNPDGYLCVFPVEFGMHFDILGEERGSR